MTRYPRLDTVLLVELFIKEHSGQYKRRALWEALPKKMMYQTFRLIIEYLYYSHKIDFEDGVIIWTHHNRELKPNNA